MARIIDLEDIGGELAAADYMPVCDVSLDKDCKLLISALVAFILGGRIIGGSASGDITTNNGIQALINKILTNPKINSAISTSVTSEDLNKLHDVSVGATQINHLSGIASNVQTQISSKAAQTEISRMAKCCAISFAASGTTYSITEASIRAALGLGVDRRVTTGITFSVYEVGASNNTLISAGVSVVRGTGSQMASAELSGLTSGKSYLVNIVCFDVSLGGGS